MRGVKTRGYSKKKQLAIFLVLLLIFLILLNSVHNVYKKKRGAEELLGRMQSDVATLKERKNFLANSLDRLATLDGIKFEIRKKLNVAEVGESVAIIVNEEDSVTPYIAPRSSWQRFKDFWQNLLK